MSSTLIKLPVVSFRKIASPYDQDGRSAYVAVVNVKDVPADLDQWRSLNPRDPNPNSGVAKKITQTLRDVPQMFFFRNRGITLMVDRVELDQQANTIAIEFADKSMNGLLDGGHTYKVIRNFVENLSEDELKDFDAFVKIEFLEGFKSIEDAVSIVESRNTSTQVKEQSLEELRQQYEDIKQVLVGRTYADRIAYKEIELAEDGSRKDIDVKEVLSYLMCFDVEAFDGKKHPIGAYSSKGAVVEHFKSNRDRLKKYIPLLPVILELHDRIYQEMPDVYNAVGRFGNLTGVTVVKGKRGNSELPFIGAESGYRIPSGFIYPVLASFRNLVRVDGDKCSWKTDVLKFWNELKDDLVSRVGEQALEFRNPNKLGKDNATWGRCFDFVELETLKRAL
jgi:hypothetical protein